MKAFIYDERNGELLATLDSQEIERMLDRIGRRDVRNAVLSAMDLILPGALTVRFSDECERCRQVKTPDEGKKYAGEFDMHCPNPECENGFPERLDLHSLMERHPYYRDETAESYLKRLLYKWREESRGG